MDRARGEIECGRAALHEATVALGAARAQGEEERRRRDLAERESALARAALLEQTLAETRSDAERGRAALEQAQATAAELHRALAEAKAREDALLAEKRELTRELARLRAQRRPTERQGESVGDG